MSAHDAQDDPTLIPSVSAKATVGTLVCPDPSERADMWPWSARRTDDGVIEIGGCALTEMAEEFGTPLFVLDDRDLQARARMWASTMTEEFWDGYGMNGGDAFYAAKAFMCSHVARTATERGMGIDTSTFGELTSALRSGVDPERIGLHGNNKSDEEIRVALTAGNGRGIARIFVDSPGEVDQIQRIAAESGVTARVMVRVKTGIHAGGNEMIQTSHEDQKFGLSVAGDDAMSVVRAILDAPNLTLMGLHNHIGSQIAQAEPFAHAARIVMAFRHRIHEELGVLVDDIDLGGGLGIAYTSTDPIPPTPAQVARELATTVRAQAERYHEPVPRVSVEPGRSVIGTTTVTVYTVGAVKDVQVSDDLVRRYVAVDGGMSDNIRPALYDAEYSVTLANRRLSAPLVRCRVVGKHCESGDIVVKDVDLPADLHRGDLLVVLATGAYGWSMASNYNMVPRPGVVAVRDGNAEVIVRSQSVEDLLACDVGLA